MFGVETPLYLDTHGVKQAVIKVQQEGSNKTQYSLQNTRLFL